MSEATVPEVSTKAGHLIAYYEPEFNSFAGYHDDYQISYNL